MPPLFFNEMLEVSSFGASSSLFLFHSRRRVAPFLFFFSAKETDLSSFSFRATRWRRSLSLMARERFQDEAVLEFHLPPCEISPFPSKMSKPLPLYAYSTEKFNLLVREPLDFFDGMLAVIESYPPPSMTRLFSLIWQPRFPASERFLGDDSPLLMTFLFPLSRAVDALFFFSSEDFFPLFSKRPSYFPFLIRLCLPG